MDKREQWLRRYLVGFGLVSALGFSFAIPVFFGDLLLWQPRNMAVELMLSSLYFAMGISMLAASRNPRAHQSLVDFLIVGNVLHAGVMFIYSENWLHIVLDGGAIGLMGVLPLACYPWGLHRFLRYEPGSQS